MNLITLQRIPNQKFSITLEGSLYEITVKESNGMMVADIVRDNVVVIRGTRMVAGSLIIPYPYEEAAGNFIMINLNEALIYYTEFGVSQTLVYLSAADLATLRGA